MPVQYAMCLELAEEHEVGVSFSLVLRRTDSLWIPVSACRVRDCGTASIGVLPVGCVLRSRGANGRLACVQINAHRGAPAM
jgi:hypothetical protein